MLEKKMVTVEKVQQDKTVTIEISGFFYQRLHLLLQDSLGAKDPADYLAILETLHVKYKDKVPDDKESLHLETLIVLIRTLEEAFHEKGFVDKEEIEVEVETDPKKSD